MNIYILKIIYIIYITHVHTSHKQISFVYEGIKTKIRSTDEYNHFTIAL